MLYFQMIAEDLKYTVTYITISTSDRNTNSQRLEVARLLWPFVWSIVDGSERSAVSAAAETFNMKFFSNNNFFSILVKL